MSTRLYVNVATSDTWNYGRDAEEEDQPDMVRLAWLLERDDGTELAEACHLIPLPEGHKMNPLASQFNGIYDRHLIPSDGTMTQFGVMTEFCEEALSQTDLIVAFAWEFHRRVLERELRRPDPDNVDRMFEVSAKGIKQVGRQRMPLWPTAIDVQLSLKPLLQIENPGRAGYKIPSFHDASDRITGNYPPLSTDPKKNGFARVHRVRLFYQHMLQAKDQMTARM